MCGTSAMYMYLFEGKSDLLNMPVPIKTSERPTGIPACWVEMCHIADLDEGSSTAWPVLPVKLPGHHSYVISAIR